jgi:hypothetical protein
MAIYATGNAIAGLDPAIQAAGSGGCGPWMPASSAGMTEEKIRAVIAVCLSVCLLSASLAFVPSAFAQEFRPRALEPEPQLMAAPDPGPAASSAIASLIDGQWRAFLAEDGAAAFAAASPTLQAIYQRPNNFMAMVAAEYGVIYRARALAQGGFVRWKGYLARRVAVTGPQGEPATALYLLTQLSDGSWRIAGCLLFRPALES